MKLGQVVQRLLAKVDLPDPVVMLGHKEKITILGMKMVIGKGEDRYLRCHKSLLRTADQGMKRALPPTL
jgi:hypothetical protein